MAQINVTDLTFHYENSFDNIFEHVSFSIDTNWNLGFIGRNGAGKSTTLKSILNLVHMDAGRVEFFGLDLKAYERDIKQRIGYTGGRTGFDADNCGVLVCIDEQSADIALGVDKCLEAKDGEITDEY